MSDKETQYKVGEKITSSFNRIPNVSAAPSPSVVLSQSKAIIKTIKTDTGKPTEIKSKEEG